MRTVILKTATFWGIKAEVLPPQIKTTQKNKRPIFSTTGKRL